MATVTRGAKGSTVWKQDGTVASTPVFSSKVVDSVGAGDAFLSVTSLCAKMDITPELLGFIGNCTGALAVRIIGNEKSVGPGPLYQFISTLLK